MALKGYVLTSVFQVDLLVIFARLAQKAGYFGGITVVLKRPRRVLNVTITGSKITRSTILIQCRSFFKAKLCFV